MRTRRSESPSQIASHLPSGESEKLAGIWVAVTTVSPRPPERTEQISPRPSLPLPKKILPSGAQAGE